MGERLAFGTPNRNTKVDRLIAKFMHHHMSTEEADFVAEMARGVGPTIACKVLFFFALSCFRVAMSLFLPSS
jgi:mediator of RNA polymerase II transcription subunit 12